MGIRKHALVTGGVYHVFTKSIACYKIFNNRDEYDRFVSLIRYYKQPSRDVRFSWLNTAKNSDAELTKIQVSKSRTNLINIIAYCIMPTHVHFILEQLEETGVTTFMATILNSYTRYFNIKHKRKGPLWESKFKNIPVKSDEQLLHLTRYVHINPTTAQLCNKPEHWEFSSYREYIKTTLQDEALCNYDKFIGITAEHYKEFTEDRIDYQRELAIIKSLIVE